MNIEKGAKKSTTKNVGCNLKKADSRGFDVIVYHRDFFNIQFVSEYFPNI